MRGARPALKYGRAKFLRLAGPHTLAMTYLVDLRDMVRWLDEDAARLDKADVVDGARVRALDLIHKFLAFPHCDNFSLMPDS